MRRRHVLLNWSRCARATLRSSSVLLACLALFGCTNDGSSIFITQVDAPATSMGSCTSSDTPLANGRWYPSVGFPYVAYFKVTSFIRSNARDLANDPNFVRIQEIEVTLRDADGNTIDAGVQNPYTVPASGPVIPSTKNATTGATGDFFAIIVPSQYAAALSPFMNGYVVAHIRAFGETIGGTEVETPTFEWPILLADAPTAFVCEADASAADFCLPGQDGARPVLLDEDPLCME